MRHLTFLTTAVLLSTVALHPSHGQRSPSARIVGISAGPTFRSVDANALDDSDGLHLSVEAGRWLTRRLGVVAGLSGHHFSRAVLAVPGCLPGGSCEPRRSVTDVWGLEMSAAFRPPVLSSRVSVSMGAGRFWSSPETDYMNRSATGFVAGLSVDVLERALGVTMRVRHFPDQLAEIRWLASPAVTVRF
jgi:hypothetical protein